VRGLGFRGERLMWLYHEDDDWVECELLHEFLEHYQIKYHDSDFHHIEKVVSRDDIKEVVDCGKYQLTTNG